VCIKTENLWYKYPRSENWVLRDINLTVSPGEFVCIAGPSGCGKSTLLYCLNGVIPHALGGVMEGKVTVDSLNTKQYDIHELSMTVGLVQQDPENQFRTLTVRDEIAFGPENLLIPKHEIMERIAWSLKMVNAEHLVDREMRELSGGEKQRVALAAALSMKPKVLILDEPTSNIDPKGATELAWNLRDIRSKTDLTIIVVEHRLDLFLWMSERFVVMNEGKILYDGPPRSVLHHGHDLLPRIGVRPPQIFELFSHLCGCDNAKCNCPSHHPLSPEEGVEALRQQMPLNFRCVCDSAHQGRARKGDIVVQVDGLTYEYPGGFRALNGIDLKVRRGEFVGIVGNNGSGKTTFLLHLVGILKPQGGKVVVFDMDIRNTPISTIARRVGMMFQYPSQQLFEDSVREEILFAPKNFGMDSNAISERFKEVLRVSDLEGLEDRYPQSLSVGQMKRLNLASILIYDPDLIILDEPFFGQDYGHAKKVMDLLANLNREEGKTVLITSHHVVELAEYAKRLLLFEGGRIIEDGSTRHVMNSMMEREEKQFFCTPVCRLAHLLSGHTAPDAPTTVKDMLSVLMEEKSG